MIEQISSLQNPRIKNILKLGKASERRKQELFGMEGLRELGHAIQSGIEIDSVFFCPEIIAEEKVLSLIPLQNHRKFFSITKDVYGKIAYRESTEGIFVLAKPKYKKLEEISLPSHPLVLVAESIEKPGNLGALLRTADAAGIDAVIVCDPHTDLYNPNVIRSSIGCIFTVQTCACSNEEAYAFLRSHQIQIYAAALGSSKYYYEMDFTLPSALVMGTESSGLSAFWLKKCDSRIMIPMLGKNDSLNVSTSAAILVFEAMRQKGFRKRSLSDRKA